MSFDGESKMKMIEDLQMIHRNGQKLELALRSANKPKLAEQVWSQTRRLGDEIDFLIGKVIDQWLGDASNMVAAITKANQRLQASIDTIAQTINTVQNVVRAVGYIDEALAVAAKLAKYA